VFLCISQLLFALFVYIRKWMPQQCAQHLFIAVIVQNNRLCV